MALAACAVDISKDTCVLVAIGTDKPPMNPPEFKARLLPVGKLIGLPVVLAMTAVAALLEFTLMRVFVTMGTQFTRRFVLLAFMTLFAGQRFVLADERKFTLFVVIETGLSPAQRIMTALALLPSRFFMDIVLCVTVAATGGKISVPSLFMALFTGRL